jgi:serine/threonine protein phosphatase PrpC
MIHTNSSSDIGIVGPCVGETRPHPETEKDLDQRRVRHYGETIEYRSPDQTQRVRFLERGRAMKGMAKSVARHPSTVSRTVSLITGVFGQDRAVLHETTGVCRGEPFEVSMGILADGHGEGDEAPDDAVRGALALLTATGFMADLLGDILDGEGFVERMETLFDRLDHQTSVRNRYSGTTFSVFLVFRRAGRVFVMSANVGDSPLVMLNHASGKTAILHTEHTWDSLEERRRNTEACLLAGRRVPLVVYSSWNCTGGRSLEDRHGGHRPLLMYEGDSDRVDEANKRYVMDITTRLGYTGGTQTARCMKQLRLDASDGWVEEPLPEHGHENFGCKPAYTTLTPIEEDPWGGAEPTTGCQMTRSLGDHRFKGSAKGPQVPLMTSRPSVALLELCPEKAATVTLMAMSDGPGDVFYWHQLGDLAKGFKGTAEEQMDLFWNTMMSKATTHRMFRFNPKHARAWDDLSAVMLTFQIEPY